MEEKNKLEDTIARFNTTLQKMYKERTVMKSVIDKQKNTIDVANDTVIETEGKSDAELTKKLVEKAKELKAKESLLEQANKDKRRLAKDLAESQKKKIGEIDIEEEDRCSKLTNLLKNKTNETKKTNDEVKRVTATNKDMQEKLNKANSTIVTLETKTTRLEKQIEDLIDACGQKPAETNRKVAFEAPNMNEKSKTKCMHNDKGKCRYCPSCNFEHSNIVCKSYSKVGFCENYDQCLLRHPVGVCLHWKRGRCEKDDALCFYRHPDDEFGSVHENDGSKSPNFKRKRTFSNQNISHSSNNSSENHFLYQKVLDLTRKLEEQKVVQNVSLMEQTSRKNMSDQFSRQNTSDQFPRQNVQIPRPATPSNYVTTAGQTQPMQMPSWGLGLGQAGHTMPPWGNPGFYQGHQNH